MGGYYDEATRKFTPYPVLEDGSGVFYKKLSYGKNTIAANEDGSYTIPEGVELKILFEVKTLQITRIVLIYRMLKVTVKEV